MDPVFKAGRELGKALAYILLGKDPRTLINAGAGDLKRAAVSAPPLAESAKAIEKLGRLPSSRIIEEFGNTIGFVRDEQLLRFYNKGYQAFCAGYLLGEVEEGLRAHKNSADLSQARNEVTQRLTAARDHSVALENQCGVAGMRRFQSQFNAQISNVNACRSNAALRTVTPHITNLANQVGNAIR